MGNGIKKKNDTPPTGTYYLMIGLSVFVIFAIIGLAFVAADYIFECILEGKGISVTAGASILRMWFPVAGICTCAVLSPVLARKRQEYRDLVEYDSFGNSRKKKFSTLSADERKRIEDEKMKDSQRLMPDTVIKSCTHEGPEDPDGEMRKLTGLSSVKNEIKEMSAQMQFDYENRKDRQITEDEENAYHMCFSGPPGTGKTTIARILTSYLYRNRVIKKNKCLEIDGNMLKGGTPSDTTKKTIKVLQAAMGGVLFIDEAYSLISRGDDNREAVATLIKFMEDYRNDFVLILAGYENEMKALISSNPGFKSRIQHYLRFPSYSMPELKEIFMTMAGQQGYAVDGEAYAVFEEIMNEEKAKKDFGNARTVRTCLSASVRKHKANYINGVIAPENKYRLCREDIHFERGIV